MLKPEFAREAEFFGRAEYVSRHNMVLAVPI